MTDSEETYDGPAYNGPVGYIPGEDIARQVRAILTPNDEERLATLLDDLDNAMAKIRLAAEIGEELVNRLQTRERTDQ